MLDLSRVPNFCSHEHWGSIDSVGAVEGGFRADMERGATPARDTGFLDILLDPYFRGWLSAGGEDLDSWARQAHAGSFVDWALERPAEAYAALRPALERQQLTGGFQCIRRGLLALYSVDILEVSTQGWLGLDAAIASNYAGLFQWYQDAMKQSAFSELIRPVHPEFYLNDAASETARQEAAFTHTVMRIDPLLKFWKEPFPRRDTLEQTLGIVPRDAASWRQFIGALLDLAAAKGAVGIKQLQAYSRSLEFLPVEDRDVRWSGDLNAEEVRVFQDWVVHECCRQAADRGWPHQIHTGTHNLAQSSPMPLAALAKQYGGQKIVLLHCWPFTREAGWLAKFHVNVYIDTCWMPILNPVFLSEALESWINYVPLNKIMHGQDATSVEMAAGAARFTREILARVLEGQSSRLGVSGDGLLRVAQAFLNDNAVAVYGLGRPISEMA